MEKDLTKNYELAWDKYSEEDLKKVLIYQKNTKTSCLNVKQKENA